MFSRKLEEQDDVPNLPDRIGNNITEKGVNKVVYLSDENIQENEPQKMRGAYVTPCPDIDIRISNVKGKMNTTTKKRGNLQNGNSLQPRLLNGYRISISNTCPFDSITEILSHCCIYDSFRAYIEMHKDATKAFNYLCYASAVSEIYEVGVNATIYTYRFNLMCKLLNSEYNRNYTNIECGDSVHRIFQLLMKDYASALELCKCECGYNEKIKKYVFSLRTHIVWLNNYPNMENELKNYLQKKTVYCRSCRRSCAKLEYRLGPYLYIDMEDGYKPSEEANTFGITPETTKTCLSDIPTQLEIDENVYVLGGIIEYQPPIQVENVTAVNLKESENRLGHYIAYCRTMTNVWIKKMTKKNLAKNVAKYTS